ncbi:MAG: FeoB-associated Cys-rich membrane protein [Desulfobacteraceae bacterium]|nr:FeoB-associated Cys-rich membrane protein [Desulfobacteraceae bacterium]
MDNILVGIIVAAAVFFSIRSFVRTYKGEGGCNCSRSCSSGKKNGNCNQSQPFKIIDKN